MLYAEYGINTIHNFFTVPHKSTNILEAIAGNYWKSISVVLCNLFSDLNL